MWWQPKSKNNFEWPIIYKTFWTIVYKNLTILTLSPTTRLVFRIGFLSRKTSKSRLFGRQCWRGGNAKPSSTARQNCSTSWTMHLTISSSIIKKRTENAFSTSNTERFNPPIRSISSNFYSIITKTTTRWSLRFQTTSPTVPPSRKNRDFLRQQ